MAPAIVKRQTFEIVNSQFWESTVIQLLNAPLAICPGTRLSLPVYPFAVSCIRGRDKLSANRGVGNICGYCFSGRYCLSGCKRHGPASITNYLYPQFLVYMKNADNILFRFHCMIPKWDLIYPQNPQKSHFADTFLLPWKSHWLGAKDMASR